MKIKSIFLSVIWAISVIILQSCDTTETNALNDSTNGLDQNNSSVDALNDPTKSRIQFKLVDAPDDNYSEVNVDIIDFQYQSNDDSGWVSFDGYPLESGTNIVDLTELIAGTSHVLADEEIEPGLFGKVRIVLGDLNSLVLDDGSQIPLKTPSAQQSGLKLQVDTNLEAGYSYTFVLDWDVKKSIVKAGKSGNYNLKPVIRAHTEINAGNIEGLVLETLDNEDFPLANVLIEVFESADSEMTESITSSYTNETGNYFISTLPIGSYTLKFTYSSAMYAYDEVIIEGVEVYKDETTAVNVYMEKSTGSLAGRVADATETNDDLKPLDGATVNIYAADDSEFLTIIAFTTTNNEGVFTFLDLLPDEYILKVMMTSYDEGQSEIIEVEIHTETDAGTILLTKSVGSIFGRVANSTDDSPLGGATVNVYAKDDEDFSDILATTTTSNEDNETKGTFSIPNLILGEYILKATLDTFDEGQSGPIEVTESGGVYDAGTINLTLTTP